MPAEINMGITEIVLLVIGAAVFAVSFFIPEKYSKQDEQDYKEIREKLKSFLKQELQMAQLRIEEKTDEIIDSASQKTERYMERITNEKIMAVQEYSDTVLEQIHKNHEEAVFLYDMLNNKHDQIKMTATEINNSVDDAKEGILLSAETAAREVLQGKIQEGLEKQISRLVEDTVQEAVTATLESRTEEIINAALLSRSQDTLNTAFGNRSREVISAAPNEKSRAAVTASFNEAAETVQRNSAGQGLFPWQTSSVTEEAKENFRELSLDVPEVIMQEEQPFLVQQVKKVAPKKKTPSRKLPARGKAAVETPPTAEILLDPENDTKSNNNKENILRLHREGKSNMVIAKELGVGIGEVKLVIGLYEGA